MLAASSRACACQMGPTTAIDDDRSRLVLVDEVNAQSPHGAELRIPLVETRRRGERADLFERTLEDTVDEARGRRWIRMGPANRLGDDFIDDAGFEQVR